MQAVVVIFEIMKPLIGIILVFLATGIVWAQEGEQEKTKLRRKNDLTNKLPEIDNAGLGSLLTKSGDELKGWVEYHQNEAWVMVKANTGTRVLYPSDVVAFEYYDSLKARQRIFYSLPVVNEEFNSTNFEFFELVRQFSTFAIVSQDEQMRVKHKAKVDTRSTAWAIVANLESNNGKSLHRKDKIVMRESETIFIARDNDVARPYLEIRNKSKTKIAGKDVKEGENIDVLDRDLIPTLFGSKLSDVQRYMRANSLNADNPNDLIVICEYYDSIAGKK